MKVSNMVSSNGNPVPNQLIVTGKDVIYFQSYQTIVAKLENGKFAIDKGNPFSVTTSKYLYKFLNVDSKTFKTNIKSGKYQIADLNK